MSSAYPNCTDCPLHETCQTVCMHPLLPVGPARFAVVGEAPGAEEDRLGEPFVGASGRLLWQELVEHGLRQEEAFVTNAVKCRPPKNRTPKVSEWKRCKVYLDAEVEHLRDETPAQVILALGATAYKALGGTDNITSANGVAYKHEEMTIVPALHPSAALRSPQAMKRFKDALGAFALLVKGRRGPDVPETRLVMVRG